MTRLSDPFKKVLAINPIIVKEVRSRMRGPRPFITLTLILLVMAGAMYGVLQILLMNSSQGGNILSPQIGQILFAVLAFIELFMICAITPAVTSGAISGEKEKQTYEMLLATPLSPTRILWGKLISALSYVMLLILAGIPLASVVFIFGGVALSDMLRALAVLLGIALAFGVLGLFMSALFGRSGRATVASYIAVVLLTVGPLFLAILFSAMKNTDPPRWILAPSPISALSAALASGMGMNNSIGGVFYTLSGLFNIGVQTVSQISIPRPLYHYSLPFYATFVLLLGLLSIRLVQPTRRWRLTRAEWALNLGSLALLAGLIAAGFFLTTGRYERAVSAAADNQNLQLLPTVTPALPAEMAVDKTAVVLSAVTATPPVTPTSTPAALLSPTAERSPTATPAMGTPATAIAVTTTPDLGAAAQAEIYTAVALRLVGVDNTYGGGTPGWRVIYLVSATDDSVGDPTTPQEPPAILSQEVQTMALNRLMQDQTLRAKWIWVSSAKDSAIPYDDQGGTINGGYGAVIRFGNLHPQKDGTIQVPASLYFANLGAVGKTYVLQKVNGVWTITGDVGPRWIS